MSPATRRQDWQETSAAWTVLRPRAHSPHRWVEAHCILSSCKLLRIPGMRSLLAFKTCLYSVSVSIITRVVLFVKRGKLQESGGSLPRGARKQARGQLDRTCVMNCEFIYGWPMPSVVP